MQDEKSELNRQLWGMFANTYKLLARAREMELAAFDLTPEKSRVLHVLHVNEGVSTLNEIASKTLRKHNSVAGIIQRMEKSGLVKRSKPKDSRQYQISITDKGREKFEISSAKSIDMAFSTLTDTEKEQMIQIVTKVNQKTRALLGMDFTPPFLR